MRKALVIAACSGAALATLTLVPGIASADTQEVYNFSDFNELDIAAGIEVEFTQSDAYSVVADFERGGPDDIKVSQSGDRLSISRKSSRPWKSNKARVTVRVTAPDLEAIEASSGSSLTATGLTAGDIDVSVSSGASADVSGTCATVNVSASSGGSADLKGLECANAVAKASSGGSVKAFASESADSNTSSGGSVSIWGDPARKDANVSRSGGSTDWR